MKPTILVTGATGAQGGSVARHLISRGQFKVRVLTRNPASEQARALRNAGAEIATGDLSDRSSLENAMKGCYGVFGLTNFWEHFGGEYQHGKNLVDAVANSSVTHFVFSTLPSARNISGGSLIVPHLDIKAELEAYSRSLGLPATYVHVAFYYENFLSIFPPQKAADGTFHFGFPQGETPLAGVSVEDLGGVVAAIFDRPETYLGKVVGVVGDDLTGYEYAAAMSEELHHPVHYNPIPHEIYATFNFPGAEELANMFEFNRIYIPERKKDLAECRTLYPQIKDFSRWLRENAERFAPVFSAEAQPV